MPEPTTTDVQGDAQNVLSGGFSGPVQTGQQVTVNVQPGVPEPPDTIKQQIKDMWVMLVSDQLQRKDRQLTVDRWLLTLTIIQILSAIAIWAIIWDRFR